MKEGNPIAQIGWRRRLFRMWVSGQQGRLCWGEICGLY
jgi:hypothetical protein